MADVNLFQGGNVEENDSPTIRVRYPRNYVQTTAGGHVLEIYNTKEGEWLRLLSSLGNFLDIAIVKAYRFNFI